MLHVFSHTNDNQVFLRMGAEVHQYSLNSDAPLIENIDVMTFATDNGVEDKGIIVETSGYADVTVSNCGSTGSCTTYYVEPVEDSDTQFFSVGYTCLSSYPGSLTVVAIENETSIFINDKLEAAVDELQTFTVAFGLRIDPTGVKIVTDKPVSVFSGCGCAFIPDYVEACDPIYKRLPSLSKLGTVHLVPPIPTRPASTGYLLRVLSVYPNTTILIRSISGVINTIASTPMGRANGTDMDIVSDQTISVHCSKPCIVVQYNKGRLADNTKNDPFMILVPDVRYKVHTMSLFLMDLMDKPYDYYITVYTESESTFHSQGVSVLQWNTVSVAPTYRTTTLFLQAGSSLKLNSTTGFLPFIVATKSDSVTVTSSLGMAVFNSGDLSQISMIRMSLVQTVLLNISLLICVSTQQLSIVFFSSHINNSLIVKSSAICFLSAVCKRQNVRHFIRLLNRRLTALDRRMMVSKWHCIFVCARDCYCTGITYDITGSCELHHVHDFFFESVPDGSAVSYVVM